MSRGHPAIAPDALVRAERRGRRPRAGVRGCREGFYVDVGASIPDDDSVTFHFYERGWRGVNVEPDPGRLRAARPRLAHQGCQSPRRCRRGRRAARLLPERRPWATAPSTQRAPAGTVGDRRIEVEQVSLARIFAEHAPEEGIDFLKVDVEGWEADVLASANWQRHRPRVVVVEAVDPAGRATHEDVGAGPSRAGYRLVLFDGLNRFYCRDEDADALGCRDSLSANVLDNWRSVREIALQIGLQERLVDARARRRATAKRRRDRAGEGAGAAGIREGATVARGGATVARGSAGFARGGAAVARGEPFGACERLRLDLLAGHVLDPRRLPPGDGSSGGATASSEAVSGDCAGG